MFLKVDEKIFIIIFTLVFLTNCGFQRLSNDKLNNFQIKDFFISGNTKIANQIKNDLMINIRRESQFNFTFIRRKKTKNISEKILQIK